MQNRPTTLKPAHVKSAEGPVIDTGIPETISNFAANNPNLAWLAKLGLLGVGAGAVGAGIHELGTPKPKPYSPRSVLQRLGGVSSVTPSGPDMDVLYPVIKKKADDSIVPSALQAPEGASWLTKGMALPALALPAAATYALGRTYFDSRSKANPYDKKLKDSAFLQNELNRQKLKYRGMLLERQADRAAQQYKLSADQSLADALNKLTEKLEKNGFLFPLLSSLATTAGASKAITGTWNPMEGLNRVRGGAEQLGDAAKMVGGLGLGALGVGMPLAAMYGFSGEKERLEKENPVPNHTDIDKNVAQAIKLRSRALTQARGLPPINLRAVPVETEEPSFKQSSDLTNKIDTFVDKLFGD